MAVGVQKRRGLCSPVFGGLLVELQLVLLPQRLSHKEVIRRQECSPLQEEDRENLKEALLEEGVDMKHENARHMY